MNDNPEPWPLADILDYLGRNHITIVVDAQGNPALKCPRESAGARAAAIPHLKARRAEVLAYFSQVAPELTAKPEKPTREAIFRQAAERAAHVGKPLYVTYGPRENVTPGPRMDAFEPTSRAFKKLLAELPPDVRYVCVEGDSEWVSVNQ